jgi:hypothetical protein
MVEPFTTVPPLGSPREPDLWRWMADYEARTGGDVLAIPHNGNLSNGLMFALTQPFTDLPIDQDYVEAPRPLGAALRGHPDQGRRRDPSVPVAERRVRRLRDLGQGQSRRQRGQGAGHAAARIRPRRRCAGLELEEEFGTNPFKFGMVGGPTPTPASPPSRRTTSSARSPRWSPTRSG